MRKSRHEKETKTEASNRYRGKYRDRGWSEVKIETVK